MSKESFESRLVFLEGFAVGVSSRIEALENRVAELSTSTNKTKDAKDCSTCKYVLLEGHEGCKGCLSGNYYANWEQSSTSVC